MARLPLVSPLERALFLKAQPYLEGISPNVLTALASYSVEQHYAAGSEIRAPGAPVESALFLGSGVVEVLRPGESNGRGARVEAPGAVGLAHHFAQCSEAPAVRAIVDTLCLEISMVDLDQILEDYFSLLLQMARTSCIQAVLAMKALGSNRLPEPGFEGEDHVATPIQLDFVQRLARAKRAPFLHGTNLTVLGELIRFDSPAMIREGGALWRRGDPIDRMAVVLDGRFRTEGPHGDCVAGSGSTVGAWEILLDEPRFEGWVAEVPSRVLQIRRELFTDLLEDHFEFARSYMKRISRMTVEAWDVLAKGSHPETR